MSALIAGFRASPEWEHLRQASKRTYSFCLDRLDATSGDRLVGNMTRRDVYLLRDSMKDSPVAANLVLTVLRLLIV